MQRYLTLLMGAAAAAVTVAAEGPGCLDVLPAENFVNELYEGRWYETGRFQTPGGAAFQKRCYCDTTDFHSEESLLGDGEATYSCRINGTDGELQAATADLYYDGAPGKFQQKFQFPLATKLDYRVMYIDENVAMEYDCHTTALGVTNYCVHFMARTPTMDEGTLAALIEYTNQLGLNNQNIEYKATKQEGCW
ncbi:uncharacterized protein LOC126996820 [Eriocheir sinensis]|uniref:uncharacterized protein LOC126996820 n=1 Tax=Eriocheir sinensis TaxID=95602 RepID=UPI0021C9B165|nr:uncharacterized protein LOC126996820 [Eriocheir sinensis]